MRSLQILLVRRCVFYIFIHRRRGGPGCRNGDCYFYLTDYFFPDFAHRVFIYFSAVIHPLICLSRSLAALCLHLFIIGHWAGNSAASGTMRPGGY